MRWENRERGEILRRAQRCKVDACCHRPLRDREGGNMRAKPSQKTGLMQWTNRMDSARFFEMLGTHVSGLGIVGD